MLNYPLYGSKSIDMMCLLCLSLSRWMTVLYSRKQATLKQQPQEKEREKRGGEEKDEEKEKLVDGEEDSRSKSFSTLLYEDKVYAHTPAIVLKSYHEVTVVCTSKSYTNLSKRASLEIYAVLFCYSIRKE